MDDNATGGAEVGGGNPKEKAESYEDYLQLNKVLDGVRRLSQVNGDPAHDEHLFIIIHQAFEIWFKQVLFDLDSIIDIFRSGPNRDEDKMLTIVNRLNRIVLIWKLVIDQFYILETMPPLNFLEFRCHLGSASGFQSLQFRLIENKFGVKEEDRVTYGKDKYIDLMHSESSKETLKESTRVETLFSVVEKWLESIADIDTHFWRRYVKAINALEKKESFESVLEEAKYNNRRILNIFKNDIRKKMSTDTGQLWKYEVLVEKEKKSRRLSYKAFQGALRIALCRDETGYCLPYQVMTLLTDVDSLIMKWRYNHVLMVHRMIGSKAGTGGSSGYYYLKSTVNDHYRVFIDFFNMSTFLIPRKDLNKDV